MQVGTLCALGTLCLDHEDHRRQLAEARVLAQIVRALDDPDAQARPLSVALPASGWVNKAWEEVMYLSWECHSACSRLS